MIRTIVTPALVAAVLAMSVAPASAADVGSHRTELGASVDIYKDPG